MKTRFEEIYARNEWAFGSEEGSLPNHTRGYVRWLERFVRRHRIRRVLDFGCGDWQFSRFVRWGEADYTGVDIVGPVVAANRLRYHRPGVRFRLYSGEPSDFPRPTC